MSAARFSFMLATPITAGALLLKFKDMPHDVPMSTMAIGVVTAAVFGVLAINVLLGFLRKAGFGVYAVYRVALAVVLFAWVARH
jgi:undecaprenyl-diphosphatase